jgi:hypothetical protein
MRSQDPWCWCHACWVRRRRRFAVAVITLLIAAAILQHGHTEPSHARPATPAPAVKTPRPHTDRRPPARAPGTTLATAGQDLTWVSFHGMQLPVSATAGPHDTGKGLASGFADTPQGALLAAINIGVRTAAQWGTAIFKPTITRQVTGPDSAALLSAETVAYAQLRAAAKVRPGQPAGQGYAAETGYRFVTWSAAAATVDVVTAGPGATGTTVLASTRIEVLWLDGDWRVVAPPGGNWAATATAITSPSGYTLFPGER